MATLLILTFQPTDVTIMCHLKDVRQIDLHRNDVVMSELYFSGPPLVT